VATAVVTAVTVTVAVAVATATAGADRYTEKRDPAENVRACHHGWSSCSKRCRSLFAGRIALF